MRNGTPQGPRVVVGEENRIRFTGRVNPHAHRQFMRCLHDRLQHGYQDVILDFSECEAAFPGGMIPLLPTADALRRQDVGVSVRLPRVGELARLFRNANWAHFLDPETYEKSDTILGWHLAAQRFTDWVEQQRLVSHFMNVVMGSMTLERDVIAGLEWAINEITDNVLNHAECAEGGFVQVSTFRDARKIAFGVADSGKGILASLREGHPRLRTDAQAIGEAMKAGVTRSADAGQGNGIAGALRIAAMSNGSFRITSGLAQVVARTDRKPEVHEGGEAQRFTGTAVYAEIGAESRFHLSEALGFHGEPHQPTDIIELQYQTEERDAVVLRLSEESTGFGSRPVGRQLRTKCMNLLRAEPNKPLFLDWTAVPMVSSSFADELVGKLFASLGPLTFSARVRNVGMEAMVRGLVDKAIMQRVAQVADGSMGGKDP